MRLVINRGERSEVDLTTALERVFRLTPASPRCANCSSRDVVIDLKMLAYPEGAVELLRAYCEACGNRVDLFGGPGLRPLTTPTN